MLYAWEYIHVAVYWARDQISISEVSYIGHILNADGVQPDPEKIQAIQDMPPPTDKKGY